MTRAERMVLVELRDHGPMSQSEWLEAGLYYFDGVLGKLRELGLVEFFDIKTPARRVEITNAGRDALDEDARADDPYVCPGCLEVGGCAGAPVCPDAQAEVDEEDSQQRREDEGLYEEQDDE